MSITIDHVVVPAYDPEASAKFLAHILGSEYLGVHRHFVLVRVNETFTLSFMKAETVRGYHMGFHIGEGEFQGILGRLQAAGVAYGSEPSEPANMRTDHPFGGQGLFFLDANGHLFEVMTQVRPE